MLSSNDKECPCRFCSLARRLTTRITGAQWGAAHFGVRVDAVVGSEPIHQKVRSQVVSRFFRLAPDSSHTGQLDAPT